MKKNRPKDIVVETLTDQEIETGRKLFAARCQFMLGAVGLDQLPNEGLPEICFAGRSNVGKSSLINALTGTKNLARTSNTPGRTQELNFFNLSGRLIICDLPGYGYAKAPKSSVEAWTRLVNHYLKGRQPLVRTFILIDSRHGIKTTDLPVFDMLDRAAQVYQIILTKSDKLKKGQLDEVITASLAEISKRPAAYPDIIATSAETGHGIADLRATIAGLLHHFE